MTPPFEFVPALPGSWLVSALPEASHEALHATAALLFGVTILEVRIDQPERGLLGHTAVVKRAERWRIADVGLGPLAIAGTAPASPDPNAQDNDAFSAWCRWYEGARPDHEWPNLGWLVRHLLLLPSSERATGAIASRLLEVGAIDADEVSGLIREAEAVVDGKASADDHGLAAVGGALTF